MESIRSISISVASHPSQLENELLNKNIHIIIVHFKYNTDETNIYILRDAYR